MNDPLPDNLLWVIIGTFSAIIVLSVSFTIFVRPNERKDLVRIAGGFAVLLTAVAAHNAWIYFIALLIGGLLIATEQFMLLLAAIVGKLDKDSFQHLLDWSSLNKSQESARIENDAMDYLASRQMAQTTDTAQKEQVFAGVGQIEQLALDMLSRRVGTSAKSELELHTYIEVDGHSYDGIITHRTRSDVLALVEVKYLSWSVDIQTVVRQIKSLQNSLNTQSGVPFVLLVVFDSYQASKTNLQQLQNLIQRADKDNIKLALFYYNHQAASRGTVILSIDDSALTQILPVG